MNSQTKLILTMLIALCAMGCNQKANKQENTYSEEQVEEVIEELAPAPEGFVTVRGGLVFGKENPDNFPGVFVAGRQVSLNSYYMSKYEVTQDEYKDVMAGQVVTIDNEKYPLANKPSACVAGERYYDVKFGTNQGRRPVENVTWFDAVYYCNARSEKEGLTKAYNINIEEVLGSEYHKYSIIKATVSLVADANGYRLPTEAEWEFAARGGDQTAADWDYAFSGSPSAPDAKFSGFPNLGMDKVGWYAYNNATGVTDTELTVDPKGTHEVGLKEPNRLGLYDMSGNVWEWCYDVCNNDPSSNDEEYKMGNIIINPRGDESGDLRVVRGGSWANGAGYAGACYRDGTQPTDKRDHTGFRIVLPAIKID